MSNVKISQLPVTTQLLATDIVPVVSSGITSQITSANLGSALPVVSADPTIFAIKANGFSSLAASLTIALGYSAGNNSAQNSNFIGQSSGYGATGASNSNFLGTSAGLGATNAYYSNFLGLFSGQAATNANSSNFLGYFSGQGATGANNSSFLGTYAGAGATHASYSLAIGYQSAYNAASTYGIGSNNIILGTNITLADTTSNAVNIGGLIFGTGSYATTTGNPYSGSANGKIGINQPKPQYSLDVSGSINIAQFLLMQPQNPLPQPGVSGSLAVSGSPVSLYFYNGTTTNSGWAKII